MMADSERGMKLWSEYGASGYSRSPTKIIKFRDTRSKLLKKPMIMTQLIRTFRCKSKVRCSIHRVCQRLFCKDGGPVHTHTHTHLHTTYLRPFLILSCHLNLCLTPSIFIKCISRTYNCSYFWNNFLSFVKILRKLDNFLWINRNKPFNVELSHFIYRRFSNLPLLIPSLHSVNY